MIGKTMFGDVKGKNLIFCITSCVIFTVQIAMAFLFLSGIVSYYGEPVTALGAIDLILNVFNIAVGNIFETLLKLMLGIVYIVATVIIIKNVIASISYFIYAAFDKGKKSAQFRENAFLSLLGYVGSTLRMCFMFIMLSIMTSVDFTISDMGLAVLILGLIVYLGSCGVMAYLKQFKLECLLYRMGATLIMVLSYVLLVSKLQVASFEQLIYGFNVLFGGYLGAISAEAVFSTLTLIAMPILYIVLQCSIISYITDVWGNDFYRSVDAGTFASGKFMGMAIAIATVNLVVSMILNNMEAVGVSQVYAIIENELPLLIASISLFVCYRIEEFEDVKPIPVKEESAEQEVAAAEEDKTATPEVKKEKEPVAPVVKEETPAPVAEPTPVVEPVAPAPVQTQTDDIEKLKQFKELLDSGAITQEEYDIKKKQILGL